MQRDDGALIGGWLAVFLWEGGVMDGLAKGGSLVARWLSAADSGGTRVRGAGKQSGHCYLAGRSKLSPLIFAVMSEENTSYQRIFIQQRVEERSGARKKNRESQPVAVIVIRCDMVVTKTLNGLIIMTLGIFNAIYNCPCFFLLWHDDVLGYYANYHNLGFDFLDFFNPIFMLKKTLKMRILEKMCWQSQSGSKLETCLKCLNFACNGKKKSCFHLLC